MSPRADFAARSALRALQQAIAATSDADAEQLVDSALRFLRVVMKEAHV